LPDFPPLSEKVDFPSGRLVNFPPGRLVDFPTGVIGDCYRKSHIVNAATGAGEKYQVKVRVYKIAWWVIKTPIPTAEDAAGIGVYESKIYVAGGYLNGLKHYLYDPALDSWDDTPTDLPEQRWDCGAAVVGQYFYILGGSTNGNAFKTTYRYDLIGGGAWVLRADMNYNHAKTAVSVHNGEIYVFCAIWPTGSEHVHVERYNPTANSWTNRNDAPTYLLAAIPESVDGYVYLLASMFGSTVVNNFYRYDPVTDTYSGMHDLDIPATFSTTENLVRIGRDIYHCGGTEQIGGLWYKSKRVFKYNIDSNSWVEVASMNYGRQYPSVAVANNKIYVIGGRAGANDPDVGSRYDYNEQYASPPVDSGNTVYVGVKCRDDFGDVRFAGGAGLTVLDYWIESKVDGQYADFWVEVAEDLSLVNRTIYVYYGKSDKTTTSNGSNTFLFFDDFTGDLSKWTIVSGTWAIVAGELRHSGSGGDNIIRSASFTAQNFLLQWKAKLNDISWVNIFGGLTRYDIVAGYYLTDMRPGDAAIHRWAMWSPTTELANTSYSFLVNTYYTFDMRLVGNSLKQRVDGGTELSAVNNELPNAGYIGLRGNIKAGKYAYVSLVWARKYTSPEPSHGAWGSEEVATWIFG